MPTLIGGIRIDTAKLDEMIARLPERTDEVLRSTALAVQGRAASIAPVDTGALANSIEYEKIDPTLYEVHDGVEYGIYQELGTYKMRAQPFMVPAIEWARSQFDRAWKELCE